MRHGKKVAVVIPALNEERSIAKVIGQIPLWADKIVVADNGSVDSTAAVAMASGRAEVVDVPERGYGAACLGGIAAAGSADIFVFLDADLSDYPERMALLVDPLADGVADLCLATAGAGPTGCPYAPAEIRQWAGLHPDETDMGCNLYRPWAFSGCLFRGPAQTKNAGS